MRTLVVTVAVAAELAEEALQRMIVGKVVKAPAPEFLPWEVVARSATGSIFDLTWTLTTAGETFSTTSAKLGACGACDAHGFRKHGRGAGGHGAEADGAGDCNGRNRGEKTCARPR